jgi:hypothetical protein
VLVLVLVLGEKWSSRQAALSRTDKITSVTVYRHNTEEKETGRLLLVCDVIQNFFFFSGFREDDDRGEDHSVHIQP